MTDEQQKIAEVLAGKTDSFRWIIERYQCAVVQMVFNMLHDRHAAEDVAQEVFLAVYRKLSTFDPMRCRFSTWIFTIARNKSINVLRKKKQPVSVDPEHIERPVDPEGPVCEEEFFRQMDQALNQLPFRQKRAFVLAEFENLPYEEIAQIECTSIGTIRSRIHRAKKKLRKVLERTLGDSK